MYYGKERAHELSIEQMVLARCPNWCASGYQVCKWNGEEFEFDEQTNDLFDRDVIAFMPLDDEGNPVKIKK